MKRLASSLLGFFLSLLLSSAIPMQKLHDEFLRYLNRQWKDFKIKTFAISPFNLCLSIQVKGKIGNFELIISIPPKELLKNKPGTKLIVKDGTLNLDYLFQNSEGSAFLEEITLKNIRIPPVINIANGWIKFVENKECRFSFWFLWEKSPLHLAGYIAKSNQPQILYKGEVNGAVIEVLKEGILNIYGNDLKGTFKRKETSIHMNLRFKKIRFLGELQKNKGNIQISAKNVWLNTTFNINEDRLKAEILNGQVFGRRISGTLELQQNTITGKICGFDLKGTADEKGITGYIKKDPLFISIKYKDKTLMLQGIKPFKFEALFTKDNCAQVKIKENLQLSGTYKTSPPILLLTSPGKTISVTARRDQITVYFRDFLIETFFPNVKGWANGKIKLSPKNSTVQINVKSVGIGDTELGELFIRNKKIVLVKQKGKLVFDKLNFQKNKLQVDCHIMGYPIPTGPCHGKIKISIDFKKSSGKIFVQHLGIPPFGPFNSVHAVRIFKHSISVLPLKGNLKYQLLYDLKRKKLNNLTIWIEDSKIFRFKKGKWRLGPYNINNVPVLEKYKRLIKIKHGILAGSGSLRHGVIVADELKGKFPIFASFLKRGVIEILWSDHTFKTNGELKFRKGNVEFQTEGDVVKIKAEKLLVDLPETYSGRLDALLTFKSDTLQGTATLYHGDFNVAESVKETISPINIDVIVKIGEGFHVLGNGFQINISPNSWAKIHANQGEALQLTAFLLADHGKISFLDNSFDVKKFELNVEKEKTEINLLAAKKARDATIYLRIIGNLFSPKVELFSDPPKEKSEILKALGWDILAELSKKEIAKVLTRSFKALFGERIEKEISTPIRRVFYKTLSLEEFSLSFEPSFENPFSPPSWELKIGKYIGKGLSLKYSLTYLGSENRLLGPWRHELSLEYRLLPGGYLRFKLQREEHKTSEEVTIEKKVEF